MVGKDLIMATLFGSGGGSSGGGGTGGDEKSPLDALIDGSVTEVSTAAESITVYTFHGRSMLKAINAPQVTSIGGNAFYQCTALSAAYFPLVTSMGGNYTFTGCKALRSANFPKLPSMGGNYQFKGCENLTEINFPLLTTSGTSAFQDCVKLEKADFPILSSLKAADFAGCKMLSTFILRNESSAATLSQVNSFNGTPIASGTGYIYVPRALVGTYKAATNWSTFANQFRALEDYTVDGTITGELDESKI